MTVPSRTSACSSFCPMAWPTAKRSSAPSPAARIRVLTGKAAEVYRGYSAPYRGLPDAGYNGMRRFPLSIPVSSPDNGNAAAQALHYRTLLGWEKGVHFIWGCVDDVFTESLGAHLGRADGRPLRRHPGRRPFPPEQPRGTHCRANHRHRIAELRASMRRRRLVPRCANVPEPLAASASVRVRIL